MFVQAIYISRQESHLYGLFALYLFIYFFKYLSIKQRPWRVCGYHFVTSLTPSVSFSHHISLFRLRKWLSWPRIFMIPFFSVPQNLRWPIKISHCLGSREDSADGKQMKVDSSKFGKDLTEIFNNGNRALFKERLLITAYSQLLQNPAQDPAASRLRKSRRNFSHFLLLKWWRYNIHEQG